MAAQVIRYVDPDAPGPAHDGTTWTTAYLSLSAWNTGEAKNLVTADEYHTICCRSSSGTHDTTNFTMSESWITDATRYIQFIGVDFPIDGIFNSTKFVKENLTGTNTFSIRFRTNSFVYAHNIQFLVTGTATDQVRRSIATYDCDSGGGYLYLDSCIFKAAGLLSNSSYFIQNGAYYTRIAYMEVFNSIFYADSLSNCGGIYNYETVTNVYNSTFVNLRYGLSEQGEPIKATNCIFAGCTTVHNSATLDYCCSDAGLGSHPQTPLGGDWDNEFTNAAGGDFPLVLGGNCIGNGIDDPGSGLYDDDIIGSLRSPTWDIGAFEGPGMIIMIPTGSAMTMVLTAVSFAPLLGRWTWPVMEHLGFNTEILQSHNRTEQRIAKRRGVANQEYTTKMLLEYDTEWSAFEAMIHGWLYKKWRVPVWPEAEKHTGSLPAGSGSVAIDTRYADFRAASYAVIWKDKDNNEVVVIDTVADDLLTLTGTTAYAYDGTKWVMPCRTGRVIEAGKLRRYHGGALMDIAWRIEDVQTVTGFVADMAYDGYTVLTDPAVLQGDAGQGSHDPDIAILDAGTGPFEIIHNSDFNETIQSHGWRPQTKQAAWWLRQLLHNIKGRQSAFLVPTFKEDLELTRPVGAADTSLYVAHRSLTRNMGLNDLRTYLAFRPAGASVVPRKVTGISVINAAEELITINPAPGVAFEPGESLCWVDRCRLANDEIELTWHGVGKCEADTPLVRISS